MRPRVPSAGLLLAGVAVVLATTGIATGAAPGGGDDRRATATVDEARATAAQRGPRGRRGPRGLRGPRGFEGPSGVQGAQGPAGAAGSPGVLGVQRVDGRVFRLAPGQNTVDVAGLGGFVASCPPGTAVIGTGFEADFAGIWYVKAFTTFVGGFAVNYATSTVGDFSLQAICAQLPPGASAASAARTRAAERRAFAQEVGRLQDLAARGLRP
jgi:hypothetical protein